MADSIDLNVARQALRRRFGEHLRATREDGRAKLTNALAEEFKIPPAEAGRLLSQLEDGNTSRWVEGTDDTMTSDSALAGSAFGAQGLPPAAAAGLTHAEGYWLL